MIGLRQIVRKGLCEEAEFASRLVRFGYRYAEHCDIRARGD